MKWVAGWNLPGCLPDGDQPPPRFESFEDAREYIACTMEDCADQAAQVGDKLEKGSWDELKAYVLEQKDPFTVEGPDDYFYWIDEVEEE